MNRQRDIISAWKVQTCQERYHSHIEPRTDQQLNKDNKNVRLAQAVLNAYTKY